MAARITTARRAQFSPGELAVVLSHYDVGVIASARDFPRGSRHSPKLLLCAADGRQFLLKKRAAGQDDPFRVAFTHVLLTYLRERRFPVPALIGTRDDQNSLLRSMARLTRCSNTSSASLTTGRSIRLSRPVNYCGNFDSAGVSDGVGFAGRGVPRLPHGTPGAERHSRDYRRT